MRRVGTWLVVVALGGLGLAAAVDAFVAGDEVRRAAPPPATAPLLARQPALAISQLREAGVSGVLTFSDEECRLHAVSLPELEERRAPRIQICEPLSGSAGVGVVDGEVVWAGLGLGVVQVVLSREQLSRGIRAGLGMEADDTGPAFRAVQAVSPGDERYLVLADSTDEPRERVLASFEDGRASFVHPSWFVGDARAVRPSPQGGYYALLGSRTGFPPTFARDGSQLALPNGVLNPHAVAWSPDERWTALATEESVYVYPTEDPERLVIRIPLAVRDLDWSE